MTFTNVKFAAIAVLTAFSATAFGTTIFKRDSAVPYDLQNFIQDQFEQKCRLTRGDRIQIVEDHSYIRVARQDQGMSDYFYTTTFNAYRVRNNYNAGFLGEVVIETAYYAIYNGDNKEILSIKAPESIHCK